MIHFINRLLVTHKALSMWYREDFDKKVIGFDQPLEKGDLIWLETPRNPTCEVVDLELWGNNHNNINNNQ